MKTSKHNNTEEYIILLYKLDNSIIEIELDLDKRFNIESSLTKLSVLNDTITLNDFVKCLSWTNCNIRLYKASRVLLKCKKCKTLSNPNNSDYKLNNITDCTKCKNGEHSIINLNECAGELDIFHLKESDDISLNLKINESIIKSNNKNINKLLVKILTKLNKSLETKKIKKQRLDISKSKNIELLDILDEVYNIRFKKLKNIKVNYIKCEEENEDEKQDEDNFTYNDLITLFRKI